MATRLHTALIRASLAHRRLCRAAFQGENLSDGQPKVLAILLGTGEILQKDLAVRCGIEPASMTQLLKKMVRDGLIEKKATHVSGGKRAFLVALTPRGREMGERALKIVDEAEKISFEGFTEAEKETLVELLMKMTRNLTK
jgi:DNA-binding MarR family transcriptional regulator